MVIYRCLVLGGEQAWRFRISGAAFDGEAALQQVRVYAYEYASVLDIMVFCGA